MTTFPTPQPDQGATNPPNPPRDATASGNDGSGRLVAEVARALGYAGVSPFEIEDFKIEDVADRLHRAGFRLVSEDEATVERVAQAIALTDAWLPLPEEIKAGFRAQARAAVRALREGGVA
jgi:hypothetical protein